MFLLMQMQAKRIKLTVNDMFICKNQKNNLIYYTKRYKTKQIKKYISKCCNLCLIFV